MRGRPPQPPLPAGEPQLKGTLAPVSPRLLIGSLVAIMATAAVLLVVAITHLDNTDNAGTVAHAGNSPFRGPTMPANVAAPSFALLDQNGRAVTMAEYRGKPVIVTYLYTHCKDTCPITAQMIRGALDDLKPAKVPALAISVDPFRDTPASARSF